jgi:hypothetical protein
MPLKQYISRANQKSSLAGYSKQISKSETESNMLVALARRNCADGQRVQDQADQKLYHNIIA